MSVSVFPQRVLGGQLAQSRPTITTPSTFLSPAVGVVMVLTTLFIDNSDSGAGQADVSIFHDNAGTTYNENTAIIFESRLLKGEFVILDQPIIVRNPGTIGISVSTANTATFTAYGYLA